MLVNTTTSGTRSPCATVARVSFVSPSHPFYYSCSLFRTGAVLAAQLSRRRSCLAKPTLLCPLALSAAIHTLATYYPAATSRALLADYYQPAATRD